MTDIVDHKHTIRELFGKRVLASSPWHVTVGTLMEISDGYLVLTDAFRLHSDEPKKRRAFTSAVCSHKTEFEPTHELLFLSMNSIHTLFRVDSVKWKQLKKFEGAVIDEVHELDGHD